MFKTIQMFKGEREKESERKNLEFFFVETKLANKNEEKNKQ